MAEPPEVRKPVFILGPERSGTTLLYSLLANADEFYWFSRLDSLIPSVPLVAEAGRRFFRFFEKDVYIARYGKISRMRGTNTPSECNTYWQNFFGWGDEDDYRIDDDRFTGQDLTVEQKQSVKKDLKKRLKYAGKRRVLLKQPAFSLKLAFWSRVFPDALYLICVRNIEDNIISLVKAKEQSDEKFWGTKVEGWEDYMDADYQTQAMLQLKKIYSDMAEDLNTCQLDEQTMIMSYDRLISEPEQQIRKVLHFCRVQWNDQIGTALEGIVRNRIPPVTNTDIDFSLPASQILKEYRDRVVKFGETNGDVSRNEI